MWATLYPIIEYMIAFDEPIAVGFGFKTFKIPSVGHLGERNATVQHVKLVLTFHVIVGLHILDFSLSGEALSFDEKCDGDTNFGTFSENLLPFLFPPSAVLIPPEIEHVDLRELTLYDLPESLECTTSHPTVGRDESDDSIVVSETVGGPTEGMDVIIVHGIDIAGLLFEKGLIQIDLFDSSIDPLPVFPLLRIVVGRSLCCPVWGFPMISVMGLVASLRMIARFLEK